MDRARHDFVLGRLRCGVSGFSRLGSAVLLLALAGGAGAATFLPSTGMSLTPFAPSPTLLNYSIYTTDSINFTQHSTTANKGYVGTGGGIYMDNVVDLLGPLVTASRNFSLGGNGLPISSDISVGGNFKITGDKASNGILQARGNFSLTSNNQTFSKQVIATDISISSNTNTFNDKVYYSGAISGGGTFNGGKVNAAPASYPLADPVHLCPVDFPVSSIPSLPAAGSRGLQPDVIVSNANSTSSVFSCSKAGLPGVACIGDTLQPGYYGDLKFTDISNATLYLGEGFFFFKSISVGQGSEKIVAVQSNGKRTFIFSEGDVKLNSSGFLGPKGAVGATGYGTGPGKFLGGTLMLASWGKVDLGQFNTIWATISAPGAVGFACTNADGTGGIYSGSGEYAGDVKIENVKLYGQIFSRRILSSNTVTMGAGDYVPFDPEVPKITISIASVAAVPENAGTKNVTILLSKANAYPVSFTYQTSVIAGGAVAGANYVADLQNVVIPAGATSVTIPFSVLWDHVYTADLDFNLYFSNPQAGVFQLGTGVTGDDFNAYAKVTVQNIDLPPATVSIADASVSEGNSATKVLNFPVSLLHPGTGALASAPAVLTVKWHTVEGSAKSSGAVPDFTEVTAGSTTIAVNGTGAVLPVTIQGDLSYEGNESFQVVIDAVERNGSPMDLGTSSYKRTTAIGTVTNDDALPVLTVNSPTVNEGQKFTGANAFVVRMDRPSDFSACFDWGTADGTAKSPANYATASGLTLCISAGSTSVALPDIATVDDARDNVALLMAVNVSNAKINSVTMANASGTGTIADNDPTPSVSFANATSGDLESKTSRSFAVNLSAASGQTVTVNWATANDATAGAKQATSPSDLNFVSNSGTLTFAVGETSKTIAVTTANDAVVEPDETYAITLSVPATANAILGAIPTHIDTIVNNEVLVSAVAATKVYGAGDPTLTWTVSGLRNGDVLTGSLSRNAGETVGSYAIGQGTLGADPKYTILFTGSSLVITPKAVTVTADSKSKVYGWTDPVLTYTAVGLKTGDALTGSLTRVAGENVGSYAISGAFTNANYVVSFLGANLEITKMHLAVVADAQAKTYGDLDPALTYSTSAMVGTDALTGSLTRVPGESIGTYAIAKGSLANPNYAITYVGANLTITPKAVTVTADSKSKVYGSTDPVLTYAAVGLKTGDVLTGSLTRVAGENVGSYAISGVFTNANYAVSVIGANLEITKMPVAVVADAQAKTYGDLDPTLSYVATGLEGGDVLTGALTRVAGEAIGSYAIQQGTLTNPNYSLDFTGNVLTIAPKSLTVTADAKLKVYGSTDPVLTYTAVDLKTGDALTGTLSRAAGEAVGTYAIGQGSLANPNYVLTYVGADLSITPKTVTVMADSKSKVYGSTDPALTYTTVGLKTGDVLTGTLSRTAGEAVGTYAIASTLTHPNYTITYVGANLTITKLALTVTAEAKTKVYGSADPVLTYTAVGLKTGDVLTGSLARVAGETVGTYAISGAFTNANYVVSFLGANLEITKKPVAVVADAQAKIYGDLDPTLSYVATGLEGGDVLTGALTRVAGEAVGSYAIQQGALANSNYSLDFTGSVLTIAPKALTVTADAKSKTYGDLDPTLTYSTSAMVGADALTGSLARVPGETVGTYAISGAFTNANYVVSFLGANLEITKKPVAVVADAQAKTYGDLDPTLSYVAMGLEGGDVLTGALTRVAGEAIGSYAIQQGTLTNPNYSLDFTGNVLTIAPKSLTVTADAKLKTYGDLDPALTYSTSAMVGSDTLAGSLIRIPGEAVGTYAIAKGTLANPNYVLTYAGADLAITKKAIALVADAKVKSYGSVDPQLTWKTSGLVGSDVLTGSLTRVPGEAVGTYAIASTLGNPNYAVSFTGADLSITKAILSLVADAKTKIYGDVDPALTYVATGLKAGDVLTGSLTRVPGEAVGTYAITSSLDNPNYAVSFTGADLSITRKSLTVAGASAESKTYDGTTAATISGAVLSGVSGTDVVTLVSGTASFDTKEAGAAKPVTVTGSLLAGADASNYSLVEIAGLKADILPKILTVTGARALDKVYDGTTSAMLSGALLSGVVGSDAVVLLPGTAHFGTKDVGTAKPVTVVGSVLSGADHSNYALTEITGLSAAITPREVRVHADAQSKSYGAADQAWTGKDTGLVAGDLLSGTMARELGEMVGKYAIGQGSLAVGPNYSLAFFADSLTIRPITVAIFDTAVTEAVGDVKVRLTLSDVAIVPVTVLVRAHAGTAVLDSLARASDAQLDTVTSYPVTFAPGETVARFPIRVLNDGRVEPSEFFRLELSGSQAVPTGSASVTLLDNDVLPVVKITSPTEGALLGAKDLVAGKVSVVWTLDGASQPSLDTLIPEGPSTLSKCHVDAWGNRGCDSVHVTLDTTAPRVLVQAVSKDTGRTWISVTPSDAPWVNRPDVMVRWISIHDGDTTKHQDPEHLSDTLNLVSRCFSDAAGNRGCGTGWVGMDTIAPVARIVTPPAGSHWSAGQIPMLWTESHNGTTVRHDSVVTAGPAGAMVLKVCSAPDRAGNIGCTETSIVIDPNLPAGATYVDSDHDGRIDQVLVQFPRNWTGELPRFDIAYGGPGASVKSGQVASYATSGDSSLLVVKLDTPFPYGWTSSTLTDLGTMTVRESRVEANGTVSVVEIKTRFDIQDAVPPVILESRVGRTEDYAGKDTLYVVLSEAYTLGSSNGTGLFEISTDNGVTWVAVETRSLVASGSLRILLEPGSQGSVKPGMLIRIAGNVTDISGNVSGPGNTPAVTVLGRGRPDLVDVKGPSELLELTQEDGRRPLRGTIAFLASRGDTSHLQAYRPGQGYVSSEEATSVCPDLAKCAVTTLYVNRPSTVRFFVYDGLGTYVTRSDFTVTREDLARIEKDKLDRTRLQVVWNLRNDKGRQVTTGVYLVRMLIHYTDVSAPNAPMENRILRYGVKVD